jgi:hypothetical protein
LDWPTVHKIGCLSYRFGDVAIANAGFRQDWQCGSPAIAAGSPLCCRIVEIQCLGGAFRETAMNKLVVAAALAGSLISFEAQAQERAGSAALGALSGAIVLGPVGAVAGALVGYTAGPEIGRSLRSGQPAPRSRARRAARSGATPLPVARPSIARAPETVASTRTAPPVARISETPPPGTKSSATIAGTQPAPPIQTFE